MIIRQATENDYDAIYDLVKIAFETAKVSDGKEQDFVSELRNRESYLQELEFVAEEDEQLIAHVLLSKQIVEIAKENYTGVLVAPLCVEISRRGKGIGGAILIHAFEQAIKKGYTSAFLVGDPNYYGRFGFRQTGAFGIENVTQIPDEFVLAAELFPGALDRVQGTIDIR